MADAPLLGGSDDRSRSTGSHLKSPRNINSGSNTMRSILKIFTGGLIAPYDTTYSTIMILLNCEDREEQDELTKQWRDNKLSELSFIGIVSPLIAMSLVSTGSWPDVNSKSWFIRAIWYSGIIFALFSVLTAAQQTLRLHRLSAHRDGLHYIRLCLVRERKRLDSEDGQFKSVPRPFQVWSWQSSLTFLFLAVICLLGGLLVLVWVPIVGNAEGIWEDSFKLAVFYTIVLLLSVAYFIATQVSMMVGVKPEE